MSNKLIEPVQLFPTPESHRDIREWIEAHRPEERPHLYAAAGMAWNLAAKLIEENTNEDKNDGH